MFLYRPLIGVSSVVLIPIYKGDVKTCVLNVLLMIEIGLVMRKTSLTYSLNSLGDHSILYLIGTPFCNFVQAVEKSKKTRFVESLISKFII